jgi:hypothetical protein
MTDYPSSSPWGPHGPQVSVPSTTPNPTMPSAPTSWDSGPAAPVSYGGGGGGGAALGPSSYGAGSGKGLSFGAWMRSLAIAGGVIGGLIGVARGFALHQPSAIVGVVALRMGIAGAAAGASVPPAFRVAGSLVRAALWLLIAVLLWAIAAGALGITSWMPRLR